MSNPQNPQRLSGERLAELQEEAESYDDDFGVGACHCPPLMCSCDYSRVREAADQRRELLREVAFLTAELENRTRERDEAVDELHRLHETARQVIASQASAAALTVLRNAVSYLDKKGPADDR